MKKTSIKTVIAACFVGMLILSNVIMLLINQSTIEKYFTNQIQLSLTRLQCVWRQS